MNNLIDRSVEILTKEFGLENSEQIRLLCDNQILRTHGIGRKALASIRDKWPHIPEITSIVEHTEAMARDSERRRIEAESRMFGGTFGDKSFKPDYIDLGCLTHVRSVRLFGQVIGIIHGSPKKKIASILLSNKDSIDVSNISYGRDFTRSEYAALDSGHFPFIKEVTAVRLIDGADFNRMSVYFTLIIETTGSSFRLHLNSDMDGDTPESVVYKDQEYDGWDFQAELYEDLEARDLLVHIGFGFQAAEAPLGTADSAATQDSAVDHIIRITPALNKLIEKAKQLADLRHVTLADIKFTLTDSDNFDDVDDGSLGQTVIEMDYVWPNDPDEDLGMPYDPFNEVSRLLRKMLDQGRFDAAVAFMTSLQQQASWLGKSYLDGMNAAFTVERECKAIRVKLAAVGAVGIPRAVIRSDIDERHPADNGLIRRAVTRWLDKGDPDIISVRSSNGVLFRLKSASG